jgi:hypothetical protein
VQRELRRWRVEAEVASGDVFHGRVEFDGSEILKWLNEVLELNYLKLEEISNGAAFSLQFPGLLTKTVKWKKAILGTFIRGGEKKTKRKMQ